MTASLIDSTAMLDDDPNATLSFHDVGQYAWPTMPTDDLVRSILTRFRRSLGKKDDAPTVAAKSLKRASLNKLNQMVSPPACGPLLRELDKTLQAWIQGEAMQPVQLIILPPCESGNVVKDWAQQHAAKLLPAPSRSSLISGYFEPTPEVVQFLQADGLIVIPRLEDWCIRHYQGLTAIRWLMPQLINRTQPCVIGCNSWAWAFLSKAIQASLWLPTGLTFHAYDADRLQAWFTELAAHDSSHPVKFRLAETGKTILSTENNREAKDFFKQLAAHSLGIPWVAWQLWRRSLHSRNASDSNYERAVTEPEIETLWIAPQEDFKLPKGAEPFSMLVLHALLIHGALTLDELSHVLSTIHHLQVVQSLVVSGFIQRDGETYTCTPAAYPTIRKSLSAAGLPVDEL